MLSYWISSWCDDLWYTFYTINNFKIEVSRGKKLFKKKKPKQVIITIFKLLSTGLSNVCGTAIQSMRSLVHFRHKNQFQDWDVISGRKLTEVFWWPKMAYIKSRRWVYNDVLKNGKRKKLKNKTLDIKDCFPLLQIHKQLKSDSGVLFGTSL